MQCVHCHRQMVLAKKVDRVSGRPVDVYRCTFCGIENSEYRGNAQMNRH